METAMNNLLAMRDQMTDKQERAVAAQTMHIRLRGENYRLVKDGKDVLIHAGDLLIRISPTGKGTWGKSPASA